jgi:hypothetical protein
MYSPKFRKLLLDQAGVINLKTQLPLVESVPYLLMLNLKEKDFEREEVVL